ncbi:MAG TPA: hypothetical protein VG225_00550 [Terracidiphilus sp.]|jgi:hypothetical protein|nr:hypothetical protein [Terracidiphilus sp.]
MSTTAATPTLTPENTAPPIPETPADAASPNAAVQHCCSVYHQTLAGKRKAGDTSFRPQQEAEEAYCNAMPFLTSRTAVLDFIACVAHGMLLKVFYKDDGVKLITAARAALSALPSEPRPGSGSMARSAGRPRTADQTQ